MRQGNLYTLWILNPKCFRDSFGTDGEQCFRDSFGTDGEHLQE